MHESINGGIRTYIHVVDLDVEIKDFFLDK